MKITTYLSPLFVSVVAADLFGSFGQKVLDDDSLQVPGKNPLVFCADPKDHLLTIASVDLSPNPPEAGKTLTVKATGNFSEEIVQGAYVNLQVKYGVITLLKKTADLCEQMENVDKKCPLKKGEADILKDIDLPKQIPPGKYNVVADVYTVDHVQITCLTANVQF